MLRRTRGATRGGLGALATLVVSALVIGAVPAGATAADDGAATTGAISGVVRDDQGTLLAGVEASVNHARADGTVASVRTVTAADGTFAATDLEPGTYYIGFTDPQHRVLTDVRSDIQVQAGATTSLDVALVVPGVVTGTVLGADGRPVTGLSVDVIGDDHADPVAYDDETGDYLLRVSPGSFRLRFQADGLTSEYFEDASTLEDAQLLTATAGQTIAGIDVVLGAGGTISGVVTSSDGTPAADVWVSASVASGDGTSGYATTAADGSYRITGLSAVPYTVRVSSRSTAQLWLPATYPATVPVAAAQDVTGIDMVMELGGRIQGTVSGPDGPLTRGSVVAGPVGSYDLERGYLDLSGRYSVLVPPGDHAVSFSANGYVFEYYDDAATEASATPVHVAAGQVVSGIDAVLSRGVTLTGRVTDPTGAPAVGVVVRANGDTTRTGQDGRYSLAGFAPGRTAYVNVEDPDGLRFAPESRAVDVATTPTLDVTLQRGGVISGHLTDAAGRALTGWVDVDSQARTTLVWRGDGPGAYSLVVPAGTYRVSFEHDGYLTEYYDDAATREGAVPITVAAGQTVTGIDAVLARGVSITGVVRDSGGAPVPGLEVRLAEYAADGALIHHSDVAAVTATDGSYVVENRRPGTWYRVVVEDPRLRYLDAQVEVTTPAEGSVRADVTVAPGGRVTGTITLPPGSASTPSMWPLGGGASAFAYDRSTGHYTLLLPAGDYVLQTSAYGLVPEYYDDVLDSAQAEPVHVEAGAETAGIDVGLTAGGTLTGVVRDTAGRPIAGATVRANEQRFNSGSATTGADGRFTIGARLGATTVCVSAPGYVSRGYPEPACGSATVQVADGRATDISVTLPRAATMQGRVTGPAGEPVAGAGVSVRFGSAYARATTGADGSYSVVGVPPGAVEVVVFAPSGSPYVSQFYDWQPYDSQPFLPRGPATPVVVTEGATVAGVDVQLWYADLAHVFSDVPQTHPFVREIAWMKARGITTGNADGTYGPTAQVSRQAMAAFLYRLAGSPQYTPPASSPFTDVARTHPFYKEICWLAASGISTGWPDRTFRPMESVERQAMAAFLYRFAGKPAFTPPAVSPFRDVRTTDPFYKEIAWLAATGIAGGYADGGIHPTTTVDRQAMAAFLNRLDRKVLS